MFQVKDFIVSFDGFAFAVVMAGIEQNRVRSFLRYQRQGKHWQKLNTVQANQLLTQYYPHYLYDSPQLSARVHAVPLINIAQHYSPQKILAQILHERDNDTIKNDLRLLMALFSEKGMNTEAWGITGSIIINAHNQNSDIDLVCYQLSDFHQARRVIAELITEQHLQHLSSEHWQDSYSRRDCDLSFADYLWHEQRKYNKALINGRKFDISCVTTHTIPDNYIKLSFQVIRARIYADDLAFAYPAQWTLQHDTIKTLLCFTATYNGQAMTGELVEIAGWLEQNAQGQQRIIVGSSREARGEYIKVLESV